MKPIQFLFMAIAIAMLTAFTAAGADLKIIANPSVSASSISGDELKRVFLITKSSLDDGSRVEPILVKSGTTHERFVKEYLGKTDTALQTYYRSLVFTGKGSMPKVVSSDSEMVSLVAKTKGALGYVSAETAAPGVKTLEVK